MTHRLRTLVLAGALTLAWVPHAFADKPDRLGEALESWGLTRSDLGAHPKGYWTRFPLPDQIPHLLPSFPDLFGEPLKLYLLGRTMGNAAELYLDPERPDTPSALHNLVYYLGVEKRVGGFRNYTTNLVLREPVDGLLALALRELWLRDDRIITHRSFGAIAEWPNSPDSQIAQFVHDVPAYIRHPLALCILDFSEALHWWRIAFRHVPMEWQHAVLNIDDLADTQGDGTKYYPVLDDVAAAIDEHSLYYAAMKVTAACDRLARNVRNNWKDRPKENTLRAKIETPFGAIVIGRSSSDLHRDENAMLLLDPGGSDTYEPGAGSSSRGYQLPLSAIVDLGGANDRYRAADFAQGSGVLGCGLLYDDGGDDEYTAEKHAQGFGLFGLGVLYDRTGDDVYDMKVSGQGCGYFGIGLHLDGGGTDKYTIWAEGQGQGGVGGGVGVLAALGGDDLYYAEPDAKIAGRADYHSDYRIAANNVQGSGNGRRGDGSDGHSWAGGLGALLDIGGNDRYESGNWSQAIGYWFGTGILYDSEGDDVYRSVYFTQASGAHFCNAALIDESGNDRHELWDNKGAAIAFGWDYTNALLIDKSGDDYYGGGQSCLGLATGRSTVLLYDGGGDDEYRLDEAKAGMGEASPREDFFAPSPVSPYMYYSRSVGLLLDTGGRDRYLRVTEDGAVREDSLAGDGRNWDNPAADSGGLFGGGRDLPDGGVPDFSIWHKR